MSLKIGDVVKFHFRENKIGIIKNINNHDAVKIAEVAINSKHSFGMYLNDLELIEDNEIIVEWKLTWL